jgi:AraC-like DNA-binding protein
MQTKITSKKFTTYTDMSKSAINWEHQCSYTLLSYAFEGEHHVIEFPNMQLSYSSRRGGFMHDAISPKDSISIALIQDCRDKACFDKFKLHKGMILFFDDSKAFNYMSSGEIKTTIISISKYDFELSNILGKYIIDINNKLSNSLDTILDNFLDNQITMNLDKFEREIFNILEDLIKKEVPQNSKLTEGEEIALSIRDQVYHHMDGKINIKTFANQYKVTEQTIQNSFKSLFGFTPKKFLQLLKLNLVHHDLQKHNSKDITVSRVASKWGFTHMGRFSQEYTKLFQENPSYTLKSSEYIRGNMIKSCTSRQEEME